MAKMAGGDLEQRIMTLKARRKNDKINLILYAAAKGDVAGLEKALKVANLL
jgi:hypothetical protein